MSFPNLQQWVELAKSQDPVKAKALQCDGYEDRCSRDAALWHNETDYAYCDSCATSIVMDESAEHGHTIYDDTQVELNELNGFSKIGEVTA